jgi:hypothetical protein
MSNLRSAQKGIDMRQHAYIVHSVPGRVRFKVPSEKGNAAYFDKLRRNAAEQDWVRDVQVNPTTASVVIRHKDHDAQTLKRHMRELGDTDELISFAFPEWLAAKKVSAILESDVELLASRSRAASALLNGLQSVNLALKRATGNAVDLKLLFPLALVAWGVFFPNQKKNSLMLMLAVFLAVQSFANLHKTNGAQAR